MATERITANEFIDPSLLKELERINKEVKGVTTSLKELLSAMGKTNDEVKKGVKSQEELAKNKKKVADNTQKLTEQEKILQKIQTQEQRVLEMASGSYNKLSLQLKTLRDRYRAMSDTERNSPLGKTTLTSIQKLDTQLKDFDKSMGNHQRNVGNYRQIWEGVQGVFLKVVGVLAVAKGAWEGFKKVMASTADTADRFEFSMAELKGSLDGALRSIASGDWKNFFTNMAEGAQSARLIAESMDLYNDSLAANQVLSSKEREQLYELQAIYKNTSKSLKERQDALDSYIKIKNEAAERELKTETFLNNKLVADIRERTGLTDKQIEQLTIIKGMDIQAVENAAKIAEKRQDIDNFTELGLKKVVEKRKDEVAELMAQNDILLKDSGITTNQIIELLNVETKLSQEDITRLQESYSKLYTARSANKAILAETARLQGSLTKGEGKDEEKSVTVLTEKYKGLNKEQKERLKNLDKGIGKDAEVTAELTKIDFTALEENAKKEVEINQWKVDQIKKQEEELRQVQIQAANALMELYSTMFSNEIAQIEEKKNKDIEAAGSNARAKERIEKQYDRKIAEIKRKQAIADKTAALFNIAINTAQNITKTPQLTPWLVILGLLQAAIVAAQPIPKFFKGVRNFEGGIAEVGEKGSEIIKTKEGRMFLTPEKATRMVLPEGSDVITHTETERMLLSGMQPAKFDQLIREQKATRKMLAGKPTYHLNIDARGWRYSTQRANTTINHIDKYFRV